MDWPTYIKEMIFPPNAKKTISDKDLIICGCSMLGMMLKEKMCDFKCIPYLKELRGLIERTEKRVVANYIGWR